jgi:hypothetical protein
MVYGLEVDVHVLPNANESKHLLSEATYQFYKKAAPQHLVALIQRAGEEGAEAENKNIMSEFYLVSTYCQVKYLENNFISMMGVARVRIGDIKKLPLEAVESAPAPTAEATHKE